ncbi:MAG: hypothetical protein DRP63_01490 [Planctomycetota bacterium]|nr:MAG: hypothetical protein DRP63_01490 [Planctomycetota bacterium]
MAGEAVLLATLGERPGVVTAALDLLTNTVRKVGWFYTSDPDVEAASEVLLQHIPNHYSGVEIFGPWRLESKDLRGADDVVRLFVRMGQVFCIVRDMRRPLYLCIAGGRKAMTAAMAIAAQLFGADRLFHIWLDPDFELEYGDRLNGRSLYNIDDDERKRYLHPPKEQIALVELPFIATVTMLPQITAALKGSRAEEQRVKIKDVLCRTGLLSSDGEPTDLGKQLLKVVEQVEALPMPCVGEPEVKLSEKHRRRQGLIQEKMVDPLKRSCPYIKVIRQIEYETGKRRVWLQKGKSVSQIRVYEELRPNWGFGLLLETTAETEGQRQALMRLIEGVLG